MLKVKIFLNILQNILIVALICLTVFMFSIKYKMYNITTSISHLDKKISNLKGDKDLLNIELTYLSSAERILYLIEKNPKILNKKNIITTKQIKSKKQLVNISLAKAMNNRYRNERIAKNTTINDLIESEL